MSVCIISQSFMRTSHLHNKVKVVVRCQKYRYCLIYIFMAYLIIRNFLQISRSPAALSLHNKFLTIVFPVLHEYCSNAVARLYCQKHSTLVCGYRFDTRKASLTRLMSLPATCKCSADLLIITIRTYTYLIDQYAHQCS